MIVKKNGNLEEFDSEHIKAACISSAERVIVDLTDSALNKVLYKKSFLTASEIEACKDGYIYIHDMSFRRDTMNCCLFDMANVLNGGFEMSNIWYR